MAETRSRRGIFRRLGGRKSTRASAQAETAQRRDLPTYRSSGHSENEIWVANIDAETGAKYYTNTANGVRSWERPTGRVSVVDGTSLESAVVSAAVAVEPESTETGQGTKASELEPRISAIQPVTLNKSLRDLREQNAIFDAQRLANARVKTIDDILNLLGLSAKIPVFHSEGIDLAALFYVTDQSLQELGLTLGERIKLLKVVELLREMPELSNYSRPLTASNIPVNPIPAPLPSPKRKSHRSRRRRHSSSTDTDSEFEEAVLEALGKRRSRRRRSRSRSRSKSKSKSKQKKASSKSPSPSAQFTQPTPPPMPPPNYPPAAAAAPPTPPSPWTQLASSNGFAAAALGSVFGTFMLNQSQSKRQSPSDPSPSSSQVELVKELLSAERRVAEEQRKAQESRLEAQAQALEARMAEKEAAFARRHEEIEQQNEQLRREAALAQEEARMAADVAALEQSRRLSELQDRLDAEKSQLEAEKSQFDVEKSQRDAEKSQQAPAVRRKKRRVRKVFELEGLPEVMLEDQRTRVALEAELAELDMGMTQADAARSQALLMVEEDRLRYEAELVAEKARLEHELALERMAFEAEKQALLTEMAELDEMRQMEAAQRVQRDRFLEQHAEEIREEIVAEQEAHAALMAEVEARRSENEAAKERVEQEMARQEVEQMEAQSKIDRAKEMVTVEQQRVEKETERIRAEQRLRALQKHDDHVRLEAVMAAQAPSESSEEDSEEDEESLPGLDLLEALQGVSLSTIARQAAAVALKKSIIEAELEMELSTSDDDSLLDSDADQRFPLFFVLPEELQDAMLRLKPVEERMSIASLDDYIDRSVMAELPTGSDLEVEEGGEEEVEIDEESIEAQARDVSAQLEAEEEAVQPKTEGGEDTQDQLEASVGERATEKSDLINGRTSGLDDEEARALDPTIESQGSGAPSSPLTEPVQGVAAAQSPKPVGSPVDEEELSTDESLGSSRHQAVDISAEDGFSLDVPSDETSSDFLNDIQENNNHQHPVEAAPSKSSGESQEGGSERSSAAMSLGSPGSALDSELDSDADDESSEDTDAGAEDEEIDVDAEEDAGGEDTDSAGYRRGSYDSGDFAGEILHEFLDEIEHVDDFQFLQELLRARQEAASSETSESLSSDAGSRRWDYDGVTIEILESSGDEAPPDAPQEQTPSDQPLYTPTPSSQQPESEQVSDAKEAEIILERAEESGFAQPAPQPKEAHAEISTPVGEGEGKEDTRGCALMDELCEAEVRMVVRKMLLKLERMDVMGELDPSLEATYERGSGIPVLQTLKGLVVEQVEESMSWTSSDYIEIEGKLKSSAAAYTSLAAEAASAGKQRLDKREQQALAGVDTELPLNFASVSPMLKKNILEAEQPMRLQAFSDFDETGMEDEVDKVRIEGLPHLQAQAGRRNFTHEGSGIASGENGPEEEEEDHSADDESFEKESSVSYNRYIIQPSPTPSPSREIEAAVEPESNQDRPVSVASSKSSIQAEATPHLSSQQPLVQPSATPALGQTRGAPRYTSSTSTSSHTTPIQSSPAFTQPVSATMTPLETGITRDAAEVAQAKAGESGSGVEGSSGSHGAAANMAEPEGEDGISSTPTTPRRTLPASISVPIAKKSFLEEAPVSEDTVMKASVGSLSRSLAALSLVKDEPLSASLQVDTLSEVSSVLSESSGYISEEVDVEEQQQFAHIGIQETRPADTRLQLFGSLPNADTQRLKPRLSVALEKAVAPLQMVNMKYDAAVAPRAVDTPRESHILGGPRQSGAFAGALPPASSVVREVTVETVQYEEMSSSGTSAYSSLSFSESSSGTARSLDSIKSSEIKVISNVVTKTVRRSNNGSSA